jgi:hypothetical protein
MSTISLYCYEYYIPHSPGIAHTGNGDRAILKSKLARRRRIQQDTSSRIQQQDTRYQGCTHDQQDKTGIMIIYAMDDGIWYTMVSIYGIRWYTMVYDGIRWYTMVSIYGIRWYTMVYDGIWYTMAYDNIRWYTMVPST